MTLFEVDEAANRIREEVDPEANIIFGSTFDEKLAGRMRISVVATGIDAEAALAAAPSLAPSLMATRPTLAAAALRDTGSGYTQPILTQNAAAPKTEPPRGEPRPESTPEPVPAAAAAAGKRRVAQRCICRAASGRSRTARPVPIAQPAVPPAPDTPPPRARGRVRA